jgi:hypothetical protein
MVIKLCISFLKQVPRSLSQLSEHIVISAFKAIFRILKKNLLIIKCVACVLGNALLLNVRVELYFSGFNVVHPADDANFTFLFHFLQQRAFASDFFDG